MTERDNGQGLSKREIRRKRRVRNQILSYVTLAVTILLIGSGALFGVKAAVTLATDKKAEETLARELAEKEEAEAARQTQEEETVQATEEYTEDDLLEEVVESCISEMTLEDKVAGLFLITPEALTGVDAAVKAGEGTKEALAKYPVGGLVYFNKNMKSADQFKEMIAATSGAAKYPLFLATDEEGGKVARMANGSLKAEKISPMGEIGKGGDGQVAYQAGNTIGGYMSSYGLNLDFAPVADVITEEGNTSIGDRSFGNDAAVVGQMSAEMVRGLQEKGVSACLKHFPGLGGVSEDTHEEMAVSERTLEEMQTVEFPAFQAGIDAGVDFVMVSHLSVPAISGDNTPSSLSAAIVTEQLREQLGFQRIIITDAMNMKAITEYYTPGEAAVKAFQAGVDMILMPEDFEEAYAGVLEAVQNGTLSEERITESLKRVYRIKYKGVIEQ